MSVSENIISAAVSAAVGWLAASVTKVSKSDYKELLARVARLEQDHITRRDIERLEEFMGKVRDEIKADIREISKTKT